MKEENLVFIISQPRAGSTYLQNLLSNNSETNTCSEHWLLLNFINQIKPDLISTPFDNKLAKSAFDDYLNKKEIDFNNKQKQFILDLYEPMLKGFKFVIDKTPRYYEILDEIVLLFPKAKIIVLKRNPLDVTKSIVKTWDIENLDKLAYYKRDLIFAPKHIQKFCETNHKNPNVFVLKYEDLIENTESIISSLYGWIGLEFDKSVLDTNSNNKFKGLYGDPFQNSENYKSIKKEVALKKTSTMFQDFLIGYYTYLGQDFLKAYGNYQNDNMVLKKTLAFKYFFFFSNQPKKISIYREIRWRLKTIVFNVFLKKEIFEK